MNLEKRKLTELVAAEYNPRKALEPKDEEYQKIKRSIEYFGYVDPIIINYDNTIIGGHQRTRIMSDMGMDEVDVVVLDLSKEDEMALNVALNKLDGEWNEEVLAEILKEIQDNGDLDLTGFNVEEFEGFMREMEDEFSLQEVGNLEEEYKVPEVPRLICPNCEHEAHVSKFKRIRK